MEEIVSNNRKYGGINRLEYFVALICYNIAIAGIVFLFPDWDFEYIFSPANIVFTLIGVALIFLRFKNTGQNPFWSLLALMPIVSIIVSVIALVAQPAYIDTKKVDKAGKRNFFVLIIGVPLIATILLTAITFVGIELEETFEKVGQELNQPQ